MMRVMKTSKKGMPKLLVLCIAVYAFLFLIVPLSFDNSPTPEKPPETIEVAMAKLSLPAMTVITQGQIMKEKISRAHLPQGKLISPARVIGRVLAMPVVESQVLTDSCFVPEGAGSQLAAAIPKGMRAVTVSVSRKSMPDRILLYPGCVVDVLVSYRLSGRSSEGQAGTTTMLRKVKVIAVSGKSVVSKPEEEGGTKKRTGRETLVTLLLASNQAEALSLAIQNGSISLSIRNPLDKNMFELQSLPDQRPSIKRNDIWNKVDFWQLIPEDHPRRLWLLSSDSLAED